MSHISLAVPPRFFFIIIFCLVFILFGLDCSQSTVAPRLKVSENQRFLVYEDGTPFFYLGDTAWELFHRLNREEADYYLTDRAQKGFTVIQAVVLAELEGLVVPNPYGHLPLRNNDPTQPVEEYFRHVDYIVNKAANLGMFIGMLPTWGDKWNKKWGNGPEIFSPENARIYGEFLGHRYQNKPIIWILGGDRSPENEQHLAIIRAMAAGLDKGDGGIHLMTFHPMGGNNSSIWFHNDDWLDLNMFQSGHAAYDIPNYRTTTHNYHLTPIKPTIDGEPRYEDHPVNWRPENGWFNDFDVRQAAYWSMLAGAAGHTYGDHNIWQMWQPDRSPISSARTPWKEAVQQIGSTQLGYLRKLFESRPWQTLVPDQSLISSEPDSGAAFICAARAKDGSLAFVYSPYGYPFDINLKKMSGKEIAAHWFNPATSETEKIDKFKPQEPPTTFTPPSSGRGNDWVLVLEDAARKLSFPKF